MSFSLRTKHALTLSFSFQRLLLEHVMVDMESIDCKFALYDSKHLCAKTDIYFISPPPEVSTRVSTLALVETL